MRESSDPSGPGSCRFLCARSIGAEVVCNQHLSCDWPRSQAADLRRCVHTRATLSGSLRRRFGNPRDRAAAGAVLDSANCDSASTIGRSRVPRQNPPRKQSDERQCGAMPFPSQGTASRTSNGTQCIEPSTTVHTELRSIRNSKPRSPPPIIADRPTVLVYR